MIIVTVKAKPKSDHKQDFINAFHAVSELVHKEKGCIEYEIYQKIAEIGRASCRERVYAPV